MAVGVQKAGSDWQDITVWDLSTMKQMPDVLKWAQVQRRRLVQGRLLLQPLSRSPPKARN